MSERMTLNRLMIQQRDLDRHPLQTALVKRDGNLNFHFCLFALEDDFKDGFYHGLLQLHQNYPLSPPKLIFYTPNGRYQVNTPICTSFTNYHPQSWQPIWNIKTLIQAIISFMYDKDESYGCKNDTHQVKKKFAKNSLEWNLKNQKFNSLFKDIIIDKLQQFVKRGINLNLEQGQFQYIQKNIRQKCKGKQQNLLQIQKINIKNIQINQNDKNINNNNKKDQNNSIIKIIISGFIILGAIYLSKKNIKFSIF